MSTYCYSSEKGDRRSDTVIARSSSDEAISISGRDCFAEFILSVRNGIEGLVMTR
jgi:hypothetical protein